MPQKVFIKSSSECGAGLCNSQDSSCETVTYLSWRRCRILHRKWKCSGSHVSAYWVWVGGCLLYMPQLGMDMCPDRET